VAQVHSVGPDGRARRGIRGQRGGRRGRNGGRPGRKCPRWRRV